MKDSIQKGCLQFICALGIVVLFSQEVGAYVLDLPSSLAREALLESVPTAFSPVDFSTADFEVIWEGAALPGVRLEIEPESIQWVRVGEVLVVPRARLRVQAENVQGGRISHAGFSQGLAGEAGILEGRMPIALVSGRENPIGLRLVRNGQEISSNVFVQFKPRKGVDFALVDPSCSRFRVDVQVSRESRLGHHWSYIGCRQEVTKTTGHRTGSLELYVFWDGVGKSIRVGGAETEATIPSLWPLRLSSMPSGNVTLEAKDTSLSVHYFVADKLKFGFIGLGIGPYSYHFEGLGSEATNISPILNFYASYFITESLRLVAFDATSLSQHGTSDFGVYLNTEDFKIFDRRLSLNLLLGGHALVFAVDGQTYMIPGAPQGFEMIYTDAFKRGCNLSVGGFIYPSISDSSYYNVWLRWGSRIFAEMNYIAWEEKVQDQRISSRSLGLTFGFPITTFF